ncbi:hypothetical protein M404DRAFT_33045 [Pisolithus tinctorius Marx 270]|uniref:Uncharacterized protein n=1 Tax=Pisolithus tinctorius Marx 270 TaxID=870435 RepID=A0A0C3NN02_PISTI|nr:hypothetical protein M404DRAFT_33045 [Pisolithus tinctorius Marx 270]
MGFKVVLQRDLDLPFGLCAQRLWLFRCLDLPHHRCPCDLLELDEDSLELDELSEVLDVSSDSKADLSSLEVLHFELKEEDGSKLESSSEELLSEPSLGLELDSLLSVDSRRHVDFHFLLVLLVRFSSFSRCLKASPI